jgi:hypothetical protein
MQDVHSWIRGKGLDNQKWLILGKGPSFSKFSRASAGSFSLLALNHVIRDVPGAIAHIIDLDVVDACAEALMRDSAALVMPWVPHVKNLAGQRNLAQISEEHPVLRALRDSGRLLWYNLQTADASAHRPEAPVVPTRYFSAEAALGLLALSGVKTIRTLGVDGGSEYAKSFHDLNETTLLANGRSSFDKQFEEIARTVFQWNLDFGPLDDEIPVRIYVATEPGQMLATRVLEYSLRRRSSISAAVYPIHDFAFEIPEPQALENKPRTPFSFQRFLVPQAAGLRGRAIYMDSDMQLLRDIRQLWQWPMGDNDLLAVGEPTKTGRKPQFSVMLLNCERLGWRIDQIVAEMDAGRLTYSELMYEMKVARKWSADIPARWNCLERCDSDSALIHYTDMERQPWVATNNPLARIWVKELRAAVADGFISQDFVEEQIRAGFVRPTVLWQLQNGVDDALLIPRKARAIDKVFVPPYMALSTKGFGRKWRGPVPLAKAWARRMFEVTGVAALSAAVRRRLTR